MAAIWTFGAIGTAAAVFMVRFFFALQAEIRKNPRPRTAIEVLAREHREFGITQPAIAVDIERPAPASTKLLKFRRRSKVAAWIMGVLLAMAASRVYAQAATSDAPAAPSPAEWQCGAFLDAAYLNSFNDPANDLFRSRGTTYRLDEPIVNMAAVYLRKAATESSRWGMEFAAQTGQDTRVFGFSATAPNLPGSQGLRHLGPTDVFYLAPVGKGLTIQGGIFSSLIGYDSLYAKDNFNYTRPWGADFTPYLMLGVNASYPVTDKLTGTVFVVNGYWHLGNANSVPSVGGQLSYKASSRLNLKQTVMVGPHQSDTAFENWRLLSDTIAEYKTSGFTTAFEYHVGTEKVAVPEGRQAVWMAAQFPLHFAINKHWSLTERPEVYWDSTGRLTGFAQTVKANTTTLEYRLPIQKATAILRLEHRVDDSRGPQGGFFTDHTIAPGVVALTPTQNLLAIALIFTFDSSFRH